MSTVWRSFLAWTWRAGFPARSDLPTTQSVGLVLSECRTLLRAGKPARLFIGVWMILLLLNSAAVVLSQSEDFNDGDDAGWTRVDYSSQGGPAATFTVTNGAYRLHYLISSNQMATFGILGSQAIAAVTMFMQILICRWICWIGSTN